jgi:hypothetical protein
MKRGDNAVILEGENIQAGADVGEEFVRTCPYCEHEKRSGWRPKKLNMAIIVGSVTALSWSNIEGDKKRIMFIFSAAGKLRQSVKVVWKGSHLRYYEDLDRSVEGGIQKGMKVLITGVWRTGSWGKKDLRRWSYLAGETMTVLKMPTPKDTSYKDGLSDQADEVLDDSHD